MKFQSSNKNTLYILPESGIESSVILAGGRFGSFAFAEGSTLCVGQKQMCQMWAG